MEFNSKGLDLLKEFEGCSLTAYQDQKGIWTIGYGCTHHVTPDLSISQEDALSRLKIDIQETCDAVKKYLRWIVNDPRINDNQFSALVCLAYNIGVGRFGTSTLLACIWANHMTDAADQFLRWNKVDGIPNTGLTRRRQAERELFLTPMV